MTTATVTYYVASSVFSSFLVFYRGFARGCDRDDCTRYSFHANIIKGVVTTSVQPLFHSVDSSDWMTTLLTQTIVTRMHFSNTRKEILHRLEKNTSRPSCHHEPEPRLLPPTSPHASLPRGERSSSHTCQQPPLIPPCQLSTYPYGITLDYTHMKRIASYL